jgi:hypothetical protein
VCTENPIRIDWLGVVTLSQTEPNLPTTANLDPRDFIDLACWLIVQTGPISLNVTTPSRVNGPDDCEEGGESGEGGFEHGIAGDHSSDESNRMSSLLTCLNAGLGVSPIVLTCRE